jgi:SAM-dependent methyltransferase
VAAYGEDLAAIHAAGFTALASAAARELLVRLEPHSRVLELGCGDGTTARLLCDAGHEVHGIDSSPAFVELARERAPAATFRIGCFVDAPLPRDCDAVLAVGEVLGYLDTGRGRRAGLARLLARIARALRPGGLLLFDLAGPGRARAASARTWTEGDGWAVLVETGLAGDELTREIVTYRDIGGGTFRRARETHRLRLHRPADVLATLRASGFAARTLRAGYAGKPPPAGLTAYLGRKRRG